MAWLVPPRSALGLLGPTLILPLACGGEDEGDPALVGEPELIFYPEQPMVVDVVVEFDEAVAAEELALVHDEDPGLRMASLAVEDDGRQHHLRLRGLAPDNQHELSLRWGERSEALAIQTLPALPGYLPSFTVEIGDADAVDPAYRLFDYSYGPAWDLNGLFMVDSAGVTRWYIGGAPLLPGPTAVYAGLTLLDDGTLLSVRDGAVQILDEFGASVRRHDADDYGMSAFHHEAVMLSNGNILTLGNSFETVDYADQGWGELLVAGDLLVEIDPAGEIVWTWDAFDHLDPQRVTELPGAGLPYVDTTTGETGYDWTHGNGMIELADGTIMLSMRHQDWLLGIDHQSGELLWRMGPEGDFALEAGTWFHHQHSPQIQADGSLLLYDNGVGNPDVPAAELRSRAVRYAVDWQALTIAQLWDNSDDQPYLSAIAGDADRTPAGKVLVLDSALQPQPGFDPAVNWSRLREYAYDGAAAADWTLSTEVGAFVYRATTSARLPGQAR